MSAIQPKIEDSGNVQPGKFTKGRIEKLAEN